MLAGNLVDWWKLARNSRLICGMQQTESFKFYMFTRKRQAWDLSRQSTSISPIISNISHHAIFVILLEFAVNLFTKTWFRIRSLTSARQACRKIAVLSLIRSQRQLWRTLWLWRFLADMPTFTPTKRIFLDSQILSHWYRFEAQLVGNNIWKKIGILSTEFLAILICIYKSKLLMIRFSSHTIRRTKSPPQSHLALRKYSSTKSC